MADETTNPFSPQPQRPSLGTGEGEVSFAPPMRGDIEARTMNSDIKSIQESGGSFPRPYVPQQTPAGSIPQKTQEDRDSRQGDQAPPPVRGAPQWPQPTPGMGNGPSTSLDPARDKSLPSTRVMAGPSIIPPQPPTTTRPAASAPRVPQIPAGSSGKKGLFIALAVFIIVVGLAAVGYFFIYPLFRSVAPAVSEPAVTTPPPAAAVPPEVLPPAGEEAATTTAPAVQAPAIETIAAHASLLKQNADLTATVSVSEVSTAALQRILQFDAVQTPILREIVVKNADDQLLAASAIAGAFAPDIFTKEATDNFETDATLFVYTNQSGSWPGLVLKLKSGATVAAAKSAVAGLESSGNAVNFFLNNPGTAQTWKDAKAGTLPYRSVTFTPSNAVFQYIWVGDSFLVISSSYDGMRAVLNRL